jgi:hypothetical protein
MARSPAPLTEAMVHRRLDFILQEAREGVVTRDQTITFAMRVASNYYSTGRNGSSDAMKRHCACMSKAAYDLLQEVGEREWLKRTVNEHQETLDRLWQELLICKGAMTREQLARRFAEFPMVVVTKEEDAKLRARAALAPNDRYLDLITILRRQDDGTWI